MSTLSLAKSDDFWQQVRQKDCYKAYREELLFIWNKDCTSGIEELPYSLYKLFWQSGDREVYQAHYFRRRRAISAASILVLIYPEEEKYAARLMDEIFAITTEYSWCLPAHQGNPDENYDRVIDLFAAETAF